MNTVCKKNHCTGCMACLDICSKRAIHIEDSLEAYNAVIDEDKCIKCRACEKVCQERNFADFKEPISWSQGWIYDETIRQHSASGGIAYALAQTFVKKGGKVCSCTFAHGKFGFEIVDNIDSLYKFSGSKYIKSNPAGIYKEVMRELVKGSKLLFIGLPCQVAAIKKYTGKSLEKNLYTVDLICHGTPSPKVLDLFLQQYGKNLNELSQIDFRVKGNFQVSEMNRTVTTKGICDRYMIAFLSALSYTENCYSCKYAQIKRPGDITLGDSWGTNVPETEWQKGISLILCQSDKGIKLLKDSNVKMLEVDEKKAIENNHQLERPSEAPKTRKQFITNINYGKSFNKAVFLALPKECTRQEIKKLLIKGGLINLRGGDNVSN